MKSFAIALVALLGGVAFEARAEDPTSEMRREVSEMRREISDLRREIYALRLDLLTAIEQIPGRKIGGSRPPDAAPPVAANNTPPQPTSVAPPPADAPEERASGGGGGGRVTGTVDLGGATGPAYVYVENVTPQMAKGAQLDMKQSGRQFSPRHAVVQVGTKVNFPNLDSMYHNVFSKTPGSTFDLGIYRAGDPIRCLLYTSPSKRD